MDITFRTRKLEKVFNAAGALQKAYGAPMVRVIKMRMSVLKAARNLEQLPTTLPDRRHQLSGDRDEQFAVDIGCLHRLVFKPNHEPLPRKGDGGVDTEQVTAITILDVIDYH